jgi:serine/threonine protein kinase
MDETLSRIQANTVIGPYRVVRGFRARGGMARVFEVEVRNKYRQPNLPERLALKVAKEEYQAALSAEADYLSRFDHPNVVRIFPLAGYERRRVYAAREKLSFGWGWYYTMELVNGPSLDHRLSRPTTFKGLLRPSPMAGYCLGLLETLGIARQLTTALAHIHKQHVVNLDVKPGNVLFRHQRWKYLRESVPQVVLCDFGIARDVRYPRAGLLGIATPEYVSPEQVLEKEKRHQPVDERADIFSLGVVLYEMLTGRLPFENYALIADPSYTPTRPRQLRSSIPQQLEEIIMQALVKDPAGRFQIAAEMLTALEAVSTPLDWKAAARRTFAGMTLIACLAGGGLGARALMTGAKQTPTPTAGVPTSTLKPTLTKTPTPVPPTGTPSPTLPTSSP